MRLNDHSNTSSDYKKARELRNDASPFEKKLWGVLREQAALRNLKFRRQQPIHPFIADFACMKARLLIELDGQSHDTRQEYDKARDAKLTQMGFSVMRFNNGDLDLGIESIVNAILDRAENLIQNTITVPADGPPP